jgi:hypothetical protein
MPTTDSLPEAVDIRRILDEGAVVTMFQPILSFKKTETSGVEALSRGVRPDGSLIPGVVWWLQGSLVSLALALPVIVIVSGNDKKALPIIASMAVILGALIGIAGHFIR